MMGTSRERIAALLSGGKADRVGLFESLWGDTLAAWVRQGYPTRTEWREAGENRWNPTDGAWEKIEQAGEYVVPVPAAEHFDFDIYMTGGLFDLMPLRGVNETVEETTEWAIRRNGAGALLKWWKHKSGTPEHIAFRMTTREVWDSDYRPHLLTTDPARLRNLENQRKKLGKPEALGRWRGFGELFIWELARASLGDVTLYESLLLDPAWIRDYGRVYTDFFKRHFTLVFAELGKPDGILLAEDLGYRNGLFVSPAVLRELIFPFYAELVAFFHELGLPVILHSCGSVRDALPLIVHAGFDALNPMERKADGNDPFQFAERYGDRLAFIGGLDARIFESNDLDLVRREVAAYLDGMKARGARLVFASDHSLSPRVCYDTYRCAVETYRQHMHY
jgi:uroporphyrinogen decarboxylase